MAKGFIIAGYPGIGKSTLCNRTLSSKNTFIDLESSDFKSKEAWDEVNWEQKYVAKAIDLAYEGAIVFISTHELVLKELDRMAGSHGIFAVVLFPELSLEDWWVRKLDYRYGTTQSDKDYKAYLRAKLHYYSDVKSMSELCEREGSNLFEAKITRKEYNLCDIVEELKNINRDLYGEDMSKIENKGVPVTLFDDNSLKFDTSWLTKSDSYSASSLDDNGTTTDGEEHPDTYWELDENGNYTGVGYMEDLDGNRHYVHDLVYRIPQKEGKSNFDLMKTLEELYAKIDRIEKALSGEDKYIWPEKETRDQDYMTDFITRLVAIWKKFPELRFGQFIGNVIQDPALYYIEDDKLIETLKKYYNDLMGDERKG